MLCAALTAATAASAAQALARELRWASAIPKAARRTSEASPTDPNTLVGFDVEVADLIAHGLNRIPRFVLVQFASIDQSIARGDADIGLSGIEDTPARRRALSTTIPYYEFREVLAVRDADAARFRTLADLGDHRVATLGGTLAYEILLRAERDHHITAVSYDDDVHPYTDLILGRVDAVLFDNVLAERRKKAVPGYTVQPESAAISHYVGSPVGQERAAARHGERDPARRDARRHARADSPEVERVERRSGAALRAPPRRRVRARGDRLG